MWLAEAWEAVGILGITSLRSGRTAQVLERYVQLTGEYGCLPTFPVTAALVERHPKLFLELHARGVDIALYGGAPLSRHQLTSTGQRALLQQAVAAFTKHRIPVTGYRGPHLEEVGPVSEMLVDLGFRYTSNRSLAWEVMDREQSTPRDLERYHGLLRSSRAGDSATELSLPASAHGVVDLPMALPNDRVLADMLRQPAGSAGSVWLRILQRVHRLGELMVVNLSPDRLPRYRQALEMVLSRAREYTPGVWVATMDEVARWWQDRQAVTLSLRHLGQNEYQLDAVGSDRLTLLVRQMANAGQHDLLYQGYRATRENSVRVESALRPCIGIGGGAPAWQSSVLRELGFVVEEGGDPATYELYFDTENSFDNPRAMLAAIEGSDATLVRLGLWPESAACALCVTGEVPSAGPGNFIRRLAGRRSS